MSLNQVTLVLDAYTGTGQPVQEGSALFAPNTLLVDTTDHIFAWQTPVAVGFGQPFPLAVNGLPAVQLLSTDSSNLSPAGWAWTAAFQSPGAPPPFTFFLPANPFAFTATNATPCVFTAAGSAFSNGQPVTLSGTSLPAGFTANTVYYVTGVAGTSFSLAATSGGAAIASTSTGTGSVVPVQYLSQQIRLSQTPPLVQTQFGTTITPTGDTSGVADTANLILAIGALNGKPGIIYLAPGTFWILSGQVVINYAGVYIQGSGIGVTYINAIGAGDCLRMYSSLSYLSGFGGGFRHFTIDGTLSTGTGASGIHVGDIYQLEFDHVGVRKFRSDTTAKGWWIDNNYFYAEEIHGTIWAEQNANNVVFDNSANLSAGFQATGSFKGARLDVTLDCKGSGNGFVVQGGAELYNSDIRVIGNIDYAGSIGQQWSVYVFQDIQFNFTATNANPCVFTAAGSHPYNGQTCNLAGGSLPGGFAAVTTYFVVNTNPVAGTFQLAATAGGAALASSSTGSGTVQFFPHSTIKTSKIITGVECNATNANNAPFTINFTNTGVQSAGIFQCTGIMDFSGNNPFQLNSTNFSGNFQFDGPVFGDPRLMRITGSGRTNYEGGTVTNGAFFFTRYTSMQKVSTTSSATVTGCGLTVGSLAGEAQTQDFTLVNLGPGAIQMAASGSNVRGGSSCIIPANCAGTFVWEMDASIWVQVQGYSLDPTAGDIQPVGTAAAAGGVGLGADAGHVHLGFFGGLFGNGSDGVVNFNGTNTFPGFSSLAGSTYTITRDIQATSITIAAGVTVKIQSFRMFCKGTVTIANTGVLSNNGGNASGSGAGAGAGGSASFPAGRAGGAGGTGVSGAGAAGGNSPMGGNGGNGGAGTSGGAGPGGTASITTANAQNNLLVTPYPVLTGIGVFGFSTQPVAFGSGGGGGGSDASSNAGGGGGGGGGVVAILAYAVINNGTINASGGNGANGTAGNAGGGGGAAGGLIIVYTLSAWTAGTTNVAGGSAGNGSGTGSAGQAGASGLVLNSVLS